MLGVVIYRFGIQFLYRTHAVKSAIYEHILNLFTEFQNLAWPVCRAHTHTHTKQVQKSALVSEEYVCVCICKLTSALKCKSRLISTGAADVYVVNRTNDNEKKNHIVSFSLTISNESSCLFAC